MADREKSEVSRKRDVDQMMSNVGTKVLDIVLMALAVFCSVSAVS
jgi:hypothetical protein